MHFKNITRRTLIRGSAGAVMGLPWLELTAGKAVAQSATKRLVIYFSGEGNLINKWKPNVPSGAALPTNLPPMLAALDGYKSKLNLLYPIDNVVGDMMPGNGHNKAGRSILSCAGFVGAENGPSSGPSIDQYMKQKLGVRSLELKVNGDSVEEYQMLFSAPGQGVSGEANPQKVFDRLFKTLPATGGGAPPPVTVPSAADRLRAKNKDILSLVRENFTTVRGQLGKDDQTRLDIHAQRLQELEKELGGLSTPVGMPGTGLAAKCGSPGTLPTGDGSKVNKAQAMNAAMAMACNFAQIVSIQDTNYDSQTFPWLGDVSLPGGWHGCVHDHKGDLEKGFAWYATAFKDILDAMSAVPEGNGTMLDNSLVMWITEFGDGSSHDTKGIPVVLAGGLGGALKTDRYLNFAPGTSSNNRLFVSIMKLFGMPDNSFGQGPRNTGTLAGLA